MVAQMIKDGKIVLEFRDGEPSLGRDGKVRIEPILNRRIPTKQRKPGRVGEGGWIRLRVRLDVRLHRGRHLSEDCEETKDARTITWNRSRKRFVTFRESSMPVVEFYEKLGKVRKVNAVDTRDKVYEKTREFTERFA